MSALADPRVAAAVQSRSVEIHPEFTLVFVEFDDQGRFWNRGQIDLLERTLEAENRRTDTSGVAVIFFAHGWRHNAQVCDSNVACFRTFLQHIHADASAARRVSKGRLRPKRIVAVYVGWRGLSARLPPFKQLSFWSRKNVAHRIAEGDLVELLIRVELFVRRLNAANPDRSLLAVIGHSFGGTMVYAALSNILKTRVLEALDRQDDTDSRASLIRGFGDLVVLINPAFEALLYAPLHELAARFRRFSPIQTPVLITIASETDGPNRMWFPLGRRLDTAFQSIGDLSPRREIVTAMGNYEKFWSHRLTPATPSRTQPRKDAIGAISRRCVCKLPLEPVDDAEAAYLSSLLAGQGTQAPTPGSGPTPYGRAQLICLKEMDPRSPFWVVRATDEVIRGHNGIFTTYLVDFIRRVIIEASAQARPRPGQP